MLISINKKCARCGEETFTYWYTREGSVCDDCHIRIDPPTMMITEFLKTKNIDRMFFNSTFKVYETEKTFKEFANCGWFIRSIIELPDVSKTYNLEYHGSMICRRFKGYPYPRKWNMCGDAFCETIVSI